MIADNTATNAAHEIFNVLEGMSYKDAFGYFLFCQS